MCLLFLKTSLLFVFSALNQQGKTAEEKPPDKTGDSQEIGIELPNVPQVCYENY